MPTAHYTVTGMTCEHCVRAVREELAKVPGVSDVDIDLSTGEVVLQASDLPHPTLVAAAVDEAGYALAP